RHPTCPSKLPGQYPPSDRVALSGELRDEVSHTVVSHEALLFAAAEIILGSVGSEFDLSSLAAGRFPTELQSSPIGQENARRFSRWKRGLVHKSDQALHGARRKRHCVLLAPRHRVVVPKVMNSSPAPRAKLREERVLQIQ